MEHLTDLRSMPRYGARGLRDRTPEAVLSQGTTVEFVGEVPCALPCPGCTRVGSSTYAFGPREGTGHLPYKDERSRSVGRSRLASLSWRAVASRAARALRRWRRRSASRRRPASAGAH